MTTVLKLGGSVITHKDQPETVDADALARTAAAIGGAVDDGEDLVLVHGAGSFGHYHADRHGVSQTAGSADAEALAAIHGSMTDLSRAVLAGLHDRNVPALPVRPLSFAYRREGLSLPTGAVEAMLAEGFVPSLHGDVVIHDGKGATILSGDEVVVSLARSLSADRVGLVSTVPGVLDGDGEVVSQVASLDDVADALDASDATDVTGGMAGKVRTLLGLDTPAHVFGLDDLPAFLSGGSPGTVVGGEDSRPARSPGASDRSADPTDG
jgi:isopentenyl phosphate kinase